MLSSKNLSALEAASYHGKDSDRTFDGDYQAEFRSCWLGKGAAALNLKGEVVPDVFNQLVMGIDLAGNSLHAKPIKLENHRAGTDFCFSAPKPVSIAALLQQDKRVLAAHGDAIVTALTALEGRYSQARVWNRQQRRQERVLTGNITAALFPHSTSRNQDPQLHTHAFVLNATQLEDGSWRALSNEEMIAFKKLVGEIYQNQLAYDLRQIGYGIEPRNNGQFDLKGYSKALCNLFSTRRQQIETYAEQSEWSKGAKLYEQATLHTRQHKKEVPLDALLEGWKRAVAEQGLELPTVPQANQTQDLSEIGREKAATAAMVGIEVAESREFEFRRETIEQAALENSAGQQSWEQLQTAIDEANRLIAINLSLNLYTTEAAIKRKQSILQSVQQGWEAVNALASPENMTEMDTEFLTAGRRQALEIAVTSTDRFIAWQGVDKDETTHALTLYRQCAESQNYRVHEFSPQSERPSDEIWIVSEAESLLTHDLCNLLQQAESVQARVLFIGDEREPQGSLFKTLPTLGITTVNLRSGNPSISNKESHDFINLTHPLENINARNKTWEKASAVERHPRTAASDRADRRSYVENCTEQSVGERIGTAIGKRIGEKLATTQPEDQPSLTATRFAGINLEQTAVGIAETIERRAIEQRSQDLGRTFEEIDGCLQQHCINLRKLEEHLRGFENRVRRVEQIHHRATDHLSKREVTNPPEQKRTESVSIEAPSRSQQSFPNHDKFCAATVENTEIELDPSPHEWLPERDDHGWDTVRQHLVTEYKLPELLLQALHQEGWIYSDKKKRAVFVERSLDDENYHGLTLSEGYLHPTEPNVKSHATSSFWMAAAEPFEQAIVLDDSLEVLAVHALNGTESKSSSTLYLAATRVEQLPLELLRAIPQVRVSTSCEDEVKQALKENVPQKTLIDPNHPESWRGVWKSYIEKSERQPTKQAPIKAQLQM